jgi:hypothetical protein
MTGLPQNPNPKTQQSPTSYPQIGAPKTIPQLSGHTKPNIFSKLKSKFSGHIEYLKKNFNKDTAVYYFGGGTICVVLLITLTVFIFNLIFNRPAAQPKVVAENFQQKNKPKIDALNIKPIILINITGDDKSVTKEQTIAAIQQFYKDGNIDTLSTFVEDNSKVNIVESDPIAASKSFSLGTIKSLFAANKSWNYDQNNQVFKDIVTNELGAANNNFTGSWVAYSSTRELIGFKFSGKNKIIEVNLLVDSDSYYKALNEKKNPSANPFF